MSGTKVADLFAELGIVPNQAAWDRANGLISKVKGALAGLAAYASVSFLRGQIDQVVDLGGKLSDMADQTGVSAESLQELGYASGLAGGGLDSVASMLKKVSINADAAVKGGKEQSKAFAQLGISTQFLRKAKPDEILKEIADRISDLPAGTAKTALAVKLLGKSGADALPFLNNGADGLAELAAEARDLGQVLDNETVASLDNLGDDNDRVKASLAGIRNQIVVAMLPTLRKLTTGLLEWIKTNRKLIASGIQKFAMALVFALRLVGQGIALAVKAIDWLANHLGAATVIVGALTAAILILRAASIGAALASAASWLLALVPFILLATAIAAVVLIVEDLWSAFTGGESVFKDLYNVAKTWIGDKLSALLKGAKKLVNDFLHGDNSNIEKTGAKLGWSDVGGAFNPFSNETAADVRAKKWRADLQKTRARNAANFNAELEGLSPEERNSRIRYAQGALDKQITNVQNMYKMNPFERASIISGLISKKASLPAITVTNEIMVNGNADPTLVGTKTGSATEDGITKALRQAIPGL